MNQYRRWLHHQEIDQQLHTQLHHLEIELAHLQEQTRMDSSSENTISKENQLVIALMASMHTHTLPEVSVEAQSFPPSTSLPPSAQPHPLAAALSILPPWAQQPDRKSRPLKADTVHLTQQIARADTQHKALVPSLPHDALALQAKNMRPDLDAQSPTEAQRELPRWLQTLIESSLHNNQGADLINAEILRSNRLFQRWSERWGQPSSPSLQEGETMKQQTIRKEQES